MSASRRTACATDAARTLRQSIPFMTLDELLDKLLFFAVSGDGAWSSGHVMRTSN